VKIIVEIKDNRFKFEYKIGENSNHHGDLSLSADALIAFTNILNTCHSVWGYNTDKEMNEIRALAYIEKHPEIVKKFKEKK